MRKRLFGLFLMLAVVLAAVTVGCSKSQAPPVSQQSQQEGQGGQKESSTPNQPKIGMVLASLTGYHYVAISYGVCEAAKELGVPQPTILAAGGYDKLDVQIKQIEDLIAKGVDVIMMQPISYEGCVSVEELAVDQGVKVVEVGNITPSEKVSAKVYPDDIALGRVSAEYVIKKLGGKGNIVMLNGPAGANWSMDRVKGFKEKLGEAPDIKILAEQWSVLDTNIAMNIMSDYLQRFPEIDYVWTVYDGLAVGARRAAEAVKRESEMGIACIGMVPETLRMLQDGSLDMVVGEAPVTMGRMALETAVKVYRGEAVEKRQHNPFEVYTHDMVSGSSKPDMSADIYPEGWSVPQ